MPGSRALRILVGLGIGLTAPAASAWEFDQTFEGQLYEQFRKFSRTNDSSFVSVYDTYGIFSSDATLSDGGWQFSAKPELRMLFSQAVSAASDDPARVTLAPPERYFDLERSFGQGSNRDFLIALEKLNAVYSWDTAEIYAGRRPISLGVLRVFPVWNKFTRPLPFQPAILQRSSSDGAGVRFQTDRFLLKTFTILGADVKRDAAHLFEATYFGSGFDLLLLGGSWWEKKTLGFAFSTEWRGLGIKNESLLIGFDEKNDVREFQNGTGFEYTLTEKFSAAAEFLYLSQGVDTKEERPLNTRTRFMPLNSKSYSYLNVSYKFTPLWSANWGLCINLTDGSTYSLLNSSRSLTENIDLNFDFNLPLGSDEAEFSQRSIFLQEDITLGYPLSAAVSLKMTY